MSPDGIRLPEGWPVEQTALWKDGLVEVQDEGSQIIARLCEAQPGQTVIDLCAGGGGKTDRKSVVWGKSVSLRVDLGGRRLTTKRIYEFQMSILPLFL